MHWGDPIMPYGTQPAHALERVRVMLKSDCNEGHFTLDAETLLRPYFSSHCSGIAEIRHMVLPADSLCAV
jgi:hypothetical protein